MDKSEEYTHQVGVFLTTFAEIEHQTYELLKPFRTHPVGKYAFDQRAFTSRARFAQALIKSSDYEDKDELIDLLERAIELAKFRNDIAHNPVYVSVWVNEDGDVRIEGPEAMDAKTNKRLGILATDVAGKLEEAGEIQTALSKRNLEQTIVEC